MSDELERLKLEFADFQKKASEAVTILHHHMAEQFAFSRSKPQELKTYVPITDKPLDAATLAIRAIAFYLPQFHAFPENDAWWGRGFTEWTSVTRAVPQFPGHDQPRLPGELGFYDLKHQSHIMRRQVELAKMYGIGGFCFHYYWWSGKKLLDYPVDHYRDTPDLDLPYCLNWANENWSRRWDGSENELLMEQRHSPEDDKAMLRDVCSHFRNPRYLRIDGKPVFLVYRPDLLPDIAATTARWREVAREEGIGEIYLVMCETFGVRGDTVRRGFDAAVEFPPHHLKLMPLMNIVKFMMNKQFRGFVFDYRIAAKASMEEVQADYTLFRTVMPAWDNSARKPDAGHVYHLSTPELYRDWLMHMCEQTLKYYKPSENLVFINAWNEWAEGTYLEPDRRYGYAYLQATADALARFPKK